MLSSTKTAHSTNAAQAVLRTHPALQLSIWQTPCAADVQDIVGVAQLASLLEIQATCFGSTIAKANLLHGSMNQFHCD